MKAHICWWCERLNDVAGGVPCPCAAMAGTEGVVAARHRAAVQLAHMHGWPSETQHRVAVAGTSRWAA